ncbi:MAG: hypothetical protein L0Z55_09315 [Planctomycetes bacterium]|nr:hypothetical protein [Planctomycetota bacterium]
MTEIPREIVFERVRTMFELYDLAEKMMRQTLVRRHPGETPKQIETRLVAWLHERPGAEYGDAEQPRAARNTKPSP